MLHFFPLVISNYFVCWLLFGLGSTKVSTEVPVCCCGLFAVGDAPERGCAGYPVSSPLLLSGPHVRIIRMPVWR